MNISNLLKFTGNIGFPIREIDKIIHRWSVQGSIEYNLDSYINHQNMLIILTEGNEKKIFNDKNTHNGKTSTMTDILRACYFILYNHLIHLDLEINIDYDFKILITLLLSIEYNSDEDKLVIPTEEFISIQEILKFFKLNYEELYKLKQNFLRDFQTDVKNAYLVTEGSEFWIINPNKRKTLNIFQRIKSNLRRELFKGIWESHPCYIHEVESVINFNMDITLKKINYLIEFLEYPFSKENINIQECLRPGKKNIANRNIIVRNGNIKRNNLNRSIRDNNAFPIVQPSNFTRNSISSKKNIVNENLNRRNNNAFALEENESTIVRRNKFVKNAILHEKRILNFFGDLEEINIFDVKILDNDGNPINKVILGAGDGWYGDKTGVKTDIEGFYKANITLNLIIFVCDPTFWVNRYKEDHLSAGDALIPNIKFLLENPELNVLLCFMDINKRLHCEKLTQLFSNMVYEIDSDEPFLMPYLHPKYCSELLIYGGECKNINKKWIKQFIEYSIKKKQKIFTVTENPVSSSRFNFDIYYTARFKI